MKKFFVLHEAKNGYATWDTFTGEFNTPEKAISAAAEEWRYLTESERRLRVISVCSVDGEINENIFDLIGRDGYTVLEEFK